ncbi:MAG: hypothetical protein V4439_04450 [Patescibacteria group bacterium]
MKYLFIFLLFVISCAPNQQKTNPVNNSYPIKDKQIIERNRVSSENTKRTYIYKDNDDNKEEDGNDNSIEDGTHSATVEYYNSETGFSNIYTLDVEVQNGEVVQINFPNGGWLDESHISAGEIDEDGNAHIDGENGKAYEVHINP